MSVTRYDRRDTRVELFTRGGDAVFRLTLPGAARAEFPLPRDVVDRAADGDDAPLRQWLVPAGVAAALASTRVEDSGLIARIGIVASERRWSRIAWEAFAPDACVVRISDVRPRVRQVPFTFPMRVLEVGGPTVVAATLESLFHQSHRSTAIVDAAAELADVVTFPVRHEWPAVEVLHFHDLPLAETERTPLLKWLQPFVERYQTRLIVLACAPTLVREARELAQTLVDRGGPAVWIAPPAFADWWPFYAYLVHDRPLDWIRSRLRGAELFAGAGREDLVRYSPLAHAFARAEVINRIASKIAGRRTRSLAQVELVNVAETVATIETCLRILHVPVPQPGRLDFGYLDRSRAVRLGATVSTQLTEKGLHAPDVDRIFGALQVQRATVGVEDLAERITRTAVPVENLGRVAAAVALARKLQDITAVAPELRFEDHESDGMLPLAAKITDARVLLDSVRGDVLPSPRPPRHVNTAFFREQPDGGLERLPQDSTRLRPGELVHFGLQIGDLDKLVVTLGSVALLEEVFRSESGTSIEVGLTALDFDLAGEPVQHLWLPPAEPTELVTFAVRPRTTTAVAGVARLRVSLFRDNNVVQSFLVAALLDGATGDLTKGLASALHVLPEALTALGNVGYVSRLEYMVSPIVQVPEASPRALAVIANESGGEKVVTVKGTELFRVSTDPSLADSVTRVRAALDRASVDTTNVYRYMHQQHANSGDPARLLEALWDVARAGWNIFARLVPDVKGQAAVREELASGLGIHAAHMDAGAVIPWSLIYDRRVYDRRKMTDPFDPSAPDADVERALCQASMPGADGTMANLECGTALTCLLHPSENQRRRTAGQKLVCEETVICPRRFWGFMHSIEVPVQQATAGEKVGDGTLPRLQKEIAAATPVAVVAAFNPKLKFAKRHEQELKNLFKAGAELLVPGQGGRDAVLDHLEKAEPDIVYLFCHALAVLKDASGNDLGPVLDFGNGHQGQAEDVLEDADFIGKPWAHAPLVFMNGCSTAGFSPYASSLFIKRFVRSRNASAVIGTEVSVFEVLAAGFAAAFLEAFLARKAAGEALLHARRVLLAKANPLGLVYTLYGSSDLKIV